MGFTNVDRRARFDYQATTEPYTGDRDADMHLRGVLLNVRVQQHNISRSILSDFQNPSPHHSNTPGPIRIPISQS
jgi:hypothetical protein